MSIRVKLTFVLSLAVCATTFVCGWVFITLESRLLRAAEGEKARQLIEGVATMGVESQLARDPLMLLDYLAFIRRERKEVVDVRVRGTGCEDPPHPVVVARPRDDDELRPDEFPEVGGFGLEDVGRGPRRDDGPHGPVGARDASNEVREGRDRRDRHRPSVGHDAVAATTAREGGEQKEGPGNATEHVLHQAGSSPA